MASPPHRKHLSWRGRKPLQHASPTWVWSGMTYFITVNSTPRGVNQLAHIEVAAAIRESLVVRRDRGVWWPQLALLMPDHLHALISFPPDGEMAKVVRDWKHYTARKLNIRWQRDFFDHRIRNEESLGAKWDYIVQNPVRAGLVDDPGDWPHVWTVDSLPPG